METLGKYVPGMFTKLAAEQPPINEIQQDQVEALRCRGKKLANQRKKKTDDW